MMPPEDFPQSINKLYFRFKWFGINITEPNIHLAPSEEFNLKVISLISANRHSVLVRIDILQAGREIKRGLLITTQLLF